jgi:hypothetical protein
MAKDTLKASSLLHATGQAMVMLGGFVYEQHVTGDIVSEYKWVNGEPVMLIYKRVLGSNTQAFMIELADAHKFAMSNGNASKELLSEYCKDAALALRAENDKATMFRIIDIILNGLPILIGMPPEPREQEIANRPSTGHDELAIKDRTSGRTLLETVL